MATLIPADAAVYEFSGLEMGRYYDILAQDLNKTRDSGTIARIAIRHIGTKYNNEKL